MNFLSQDLTLLRPLWLLLLPLAPLLCWVWGRGNGGPRLLFPGAMTLLALGWKPRARIFVAGAVLPALAVAGMLVALAEPVVRVPRPPMEGDGIDILIAFDVSFSMNIADVVVDGRPQRRFEAAKAGIRIMVVGIGTREGGFVPDPRAPRGRLLHRGNEVVSRLRPEVIEEIATRTGGISLIHRNTAETTARFVDFAAGLEHADGEMRLAHTGRRMAHLVLVPALIMVLAGLLADVIARRV